MCVCVFQGEAKHSVMAVWSTAVMACLLSAVPTTPTWVMSSRE